MLLHESKKFLLRLHDLQHYFACLSLILYDVLGALAKGKDEIIEILQQGKKSFQS